MTSDSESQNWWSIVKPLMEPVESGGIEEFWTGMEETFHQGYFNVNYK